MVKRLLVLLLTVFWAWVIGFEIFDYHINHFASAGENKADAIVVLTGGRNRLKEAVRLLNAQVADKLFISGVFKGTSLKELQNREDVEIFNSELVTLDKRSTNTVENAKETAEWIREHKIKSIYLVTSNYHMPRSMIEFRHYSPELTIIPYPVYSDRVAKIWWKNWHSFSLLVSEYNKFLYVWFFDGILQ